MSQISLSIDILQSENEISKSILNALIPQIDNYFKKSFENIKPKLSTLVINAIKSAPEYSSLVSGKLQAEFGLPDSGSRLDDIINVWNNIEFSYQGVNIKGNQLNARFVLNMIKKDFSDVINLSSAILITEKGSELRWLEWLLLFGNKTIIKDYNIVFGANPRSRTGKAIMRGVTNGKWKVPSEFAGYPNDNWITRAIDSIDDDINKLLQQNLRV